MGQRGRSTVSGERTRRTLDLADLRYDRIKRAGQSLMHQGRDVAFHEMRFIAVTADQVGQFLVADAGEHGRIGDLEPIEMKDRKDRAIARGIQKFVGVPTRGKRARLRLTVADDAGRRSDPDCRMLRHRHGPGNNPARRLRGSTLAFPARRGLECHKARRTAETDVASRFGCARYSESAPCRSPSR